LCFIMKDSGVINLLLVVVFAAFVASTVINLALLRVVAPVAGPISSPPPAGPPTGGPPPGPSPVKSGIQKFTSEEEFKSYLLEGASLVSAGYGFGGVGLMRAVAFEEMALPMMAAPAPLAADGAKGGGGPSRVSETNVQVEGIDEPDIVKTDGTEIYFSKEVYDYYIRPLSGIRFDESVIYPPEVKRGVKAVRAFPPADLAIDSEIDKAGNLLLYDGTLLVFSGNSIFGYSVSDPKNPYEKWTLELDENNFIETSRLYNGKLYLVVGSRARFDRPCPIPLFKGTFPVVIPCIEVYRPGGSPVPVDTTYTAMVINPASGEVERRVSFVGSSDNSVIYMSTDAIYLAYGRPAEIVGVYYNFLAEAAHDLFPASLVERIGKLGTYDISESAKLTELGIILSQYQSSLSSDEQLKLENELANRGKDYFKAHARELEKTEIVKINVRDFAVAATGQVPGALLNQFSLDEFKNHLRVAVTIGERSRFWGFVGFSGQTESVNDVYILDNDLETVGSVEGLGVTERIYSVRFVGDKGYVVTFRQVDPFYVLDLSNPRAPEMKGELKIPGFSSYLHPISRTRVLGVGQEGSQVKLSLFDVADPANPKEAAKYLLSEYWTEVSSNYHAFLLDDKHEVFFVPGGKGGYVFSYVNDKLELKKVVSGIAVKRAVYLDDYLYIIGQDKIVVINENDWKEVNKLNL